ncbi:aromatic ring-opening dioxygenase subunit LigA [Phenylobacterium immobile]|uniref:aromatic ring-opening dioxygenase subunit LigA n=1 Tax=Phenylobacterium immobile TaxID=21 RepID=UPI000B244D7A|nr:aromatic ring-opening dioxygenase subunit LigA [Phenylobacterium immobile]
MSLYQLSKLLFQLNRDDDLKQRFAADPAGVVKGLPLTEEEQRALLEPDIGLLYVLGVNGQILMHYAAFCGVEWSDYLQRMRDGVKIHGPVRAGIYAMTTGVDEKIAGA